MGNELSRLTLLVNHYLGGAARSLLNLLHITPLSAVTPIPENVVMSMMVFLIGALVALWLKPRLSVDNPGGAQQVAELLFTNPIGFGIQDLLDENVHHGGRKYIPLIGSVSIFILLSNLLSLFPEFTAPTGQKMVPLGCATIIFLYFNWQGIRHHGPFKYLKHFAGPVWWLSWLMFPVEIISTCARVLSLTVRLWANIFASDLLYVIFLGLLVEPAVWGWHRSPALGVALGIVPAILPIPFILLQIFVAIIQTYVFTLLPSIYIGIATADEH